MAIERCHMCERFIEDDEALYDSDFAYCETCAYEDLFDE